MIPRPNISGVRPRPPASRIGHGARVALALAVSAAVLLPLGSVAQPEAPLTPVSADEQRAAAAQAPDSIGPLTDAEHSKLLRAVQLQHWMAQPMALPLALCVQESSTDWPRGEPQDSDIEQWRLASELCSRVQDPAQGSFRLVVQARKNLQSSVQRIQAVWQQCAACAQIAMRQPAQAVTCLQIALGRPPSAEEVQWLLAQQDSARAAQSGR